MDRRHRPHTGCGIRQTVASLSPDGICEIAINVRNRQRETFWVCNRHTAQTLRIFMQPTFALFNDLCTPTHRRIDQLVWLFRGPFQTASFAEDLDLKSVLSTDGHG